VRRHDWPWTGLVLLTIAIAVGADGAARAQGPAPLDTTRSPPFTALSNTTPLVVGMNTERPRRRWGRN